MAGFPFETICGLEPAVVCPVGASPDCSQKAGDDSTGSTRKSLAAAKASCVNATGRIVGFWCLSLSGESIGAGLNGSLSGTGVNSTAWNAGATGWP